MPLFPSCPPLFPFLTKVPSSALSDIPRERSAVLSRLARKALQMSADRSGLVLRRLEKGDNFAPVPENGVYWSLTHKSGWVGAVAAQQPVGIDLERIKPVRRRLFAKVAPQEDWDLLRGADENTFFRLWTAKEAVVKAEGVGWAGFSRCRVAAPETGGRLELVYQKRRYPIAFKCFDGHIAAITSRPERVQWQIVSAW